MKKIVTIFTIFTLSTQISAQMKAITEKGDTIRVFPNGTWEKINLNQKSDSIKSIVNATVEVDEFTNSKKITTEVWPKFGISETNQGISGSLKSMDGLTAVSITYLGDLGCMSKYDTTMQVKLANGDIVEFIQISDTDCSDYANALFFPLQKDDLNNPNFKNIIADNYELLKEYDWTAIRLHGSRYYVDLKPNPTRRIENPKQFFRQHLIAVENKQ